MHESYHSSSYDRMCTTGDSRRRVHPQPPGNVQLSEVSGRRGNGLESSPNAAAQNEENQERYPAGPMRSRSSIHPSFEIRIELELDRDVVATSAIFRPSRRSDKRRGEEKRREEKREGHASRAIRRLLSELELCSKRADGAV